MRGAAALRLLESLPSAGEGGEELCAQLAQITSLQLGGLHLSTFPPSLTRLPALTDLSLSANALLSIPPQIGTLTSLKSLSLAGNTLHQLPSEIGSLKELRTLVLAQNSLYELPSSLGKMASLHMLSLSENKLAELPAAIGSLTALTSLRLDQNELRSLPAELGNMVSLEHLSAAANQLATIPPEVGELRSLRTLQLRDNRLTQLPAELGQLGGLQTLALSGNRLASLPEELQRCSSLRMLALSSNLLSELPPDLGALPGLEELRLDDNRLHHLAVSSDSSFARLRILGLSVNPDLTSLPAALSRCARLQHLIIGAAKLTMLPDLAHLEELEVLTVSGNQLTSLPHSIGQLRRLTSLEVGDNKLSELPPSVGELGALRTLQARENMLSCLPSTVGNLSMLQTLGLAGNRLTSLPEEICQLGALRLLALPCNRLESLPSKLNHLGELLSLLLDDNRLTTLPDEIEQLERLVELGLSANCLRALPRLNRLHRIRHLRIHSNQLHSIPTVLLHLPLAEPLTWHDNPLTVQSVPYAPLLPSRNGPSESFIDPHDSPLSQKVSSKLQSDPETNPLTTQNNPGQVLSNPAPLIHPAGQVKKTRPSVALLLPGLVREYSHGSAWRRLVESYSHVWDIRVFMAVWEVRGGLSNNFAQSADKKASQKIDISELAANYPHAHIEVVGLEHWVDQDKQGNDGRYINQWRMVERCWKLMLRRMESTRDPMPDFVIRSRPDARVACLPRQLQREGRYLALPEDFWGSDAFFYGDFNSMKSLCGELASHYDEYTVTLGRASSEPMMMHHIQQCELTLVRFPRCLCIDRYQAITD